MTTLIARFPKQSPPLVSLVTAEVVGEKTIKWTPKPDQSGAELAQYPKGYTLRGDHAIARYIARANPSNELFGSSDNSFSTSDIDQWLDFALSNLGSTVEESLFTEHCSFLSLYLTMRAFLSGYSLTLADVAVWAALKVHPLWEKVSESPHLAQLNRWFNHVESLTAFHKVVTKYLPSSKGKKEKAVTAKYLELPNAEEGKVVTRFPPEPSGYLHLGHVKAALLNNYYARKYNGKLILRFDDTNPTKENAEFVDMITQDLATLGIVPDVTTHTSDYFEKLLEYGDRMIKEGLAYIDKTPASQVKEERMQMIESKYRNNTVEENMRLWNEMKIGSAEGIQCVMRAKISMTSLNGCMRDPSLYRVVTSPPHHRTGGRFKAYPIYDFAVPIVDSLEGVTHSLRSNEYHDRDEQYAWVIQALGLRKPIIQDFSRLNFMYTLLSKRKLQWFVDEGIVESWASPAFPTVQGILRRGLRVSALKKFIFDQGSSKRDNLQGMEKLWSLNSQELDPAVPRFTAVKTEGRVTLRLTNGPADPVYKTVPSHPKNKEVGTKVITYYHTVLLEQEDARVLKVNEEVTLMHWGNAIIRAINVGEGGVITSMEGELHLEGSVKSTQWKLTWLPDLPSLIPVKLLEYDYLITKPKLDAGDDFQRVANRSIVHVTEALGDPNLRLAGKGTSMQLERRGYFIVDVPYIGFDSASPLVLIMIPDGRQSTQSHLSSKVVLKGTGTGAVSNKAKGKGKDVASAPPTKN